MPLRKSIFALLIASLLSGCFGSGDDTPTSTTSNPDPTTPATGNTVYLPQSFTLTSQPQTISLPAHWTLMDESNEKSFLAKGLEGSLVILPKVRKEQTVTDLIQGATAGFHFAEPLGPDSFQGQESATSPLRYYQLRQLQSPTQPIDFLASCSVTVPTAVSFCQQALSSWQLQ